MMTTTNEKAPGAINTEGLDNLPTNAADSATAKEIFTLTAQLALNGQAVYAQAGGGFLVSKYGYTHHADDLEELRHFARKLGVTHG